MTSKPPHAAIAASYLLEVWRAMTELNLTEAQVATIAKPLVELEECLMHYNVIYKPEGAR